MSKDIFIKKGLDIPLYGKSIKKIVKIPLSRIYSIIISDFHGINPVINIKINSYVKAGDILFRAKIDKRIIFPSPISGKIIEINKDFTKKVSNIKILCDKVIKYKKINPINPNLLSYNEIKNYFLNNGCWIFIKQRPYDIIALTNKKPKSIFISFYDTSPIAPEFNFIIKNKEKEIITAIIALKKFTLGNIYISVSKNTYYSFLLKYDYIIIYKLHGPHPSGNISTLISNVDPINKGEVIWTINPYDLIIIGELFITGKWNAERIISISGPQVKYPCYVKTIIGAKVSDIILNNIKSGNNRIISGNILTGKKIYINDYLRYYSNQITIIEEGDKYDLFGWVFSKYNKFSILRFKYFKQKKFYFNTNTNGEKRPFLLTGWYEKYFPFDIYPIYLLKAVLARDLEKMEQLGIYEIAPEDFAITEYIDPSKNEHQKIIRDGLDFLIQKLEIN